MTSSTRATALRPAHRSAAVGLIVCSASGCLARFDPATQGWDGRCDACLAGEDDHVDGAHSEVQLSCWLCLNDDIRSGPETLRAGRPAA